MESEVLNRLLAKLDSHQTIQLTEEEERVVIASLSSSDLIDYGSSRATYKFKGKYVVKIPMAEGGVNQCKVERNFYLNYGHSGAFAHIYAYGKLITIMELLTDTAYFELDELYCQKDNDSDFVSDDIIEVIELANELTDYDGGDNGQVGYSPLQNKWVLYDYGYTHDYDRDKIVDDVFSWIDEINPIEHALWMLVNDTIPTKSEMYELVYDAVKERKRAEDEEE